MTAITSALVAAAETEDPATTLVARSNAVATLFAKAFPFIPVTSSLLEKNFGASRK